MPGMTHRRLMLPAVALVTLCVASCATTSGRLDFPQKTPHSWPTVRCTPDNRGVAGTTQAAIDSLCWESKTGGEAASEPTVSDGRLYFSGHDRRLEVFDAENGDRVFRERFDGPVSGTLVGNGAITFLTDQVEQRAFTYGFGPAGRRLSFPIPPSACAPRRLTDSTLLVAGLRGMLQSCAADGRVVWSRETEGPILSTPALVDSIIYAASGRTVLAINARNGTEVWQHRSTGAVRAAPSVKERVYFGSSDSLVYALDPLTGAMVWFASVDGAVATTPVAGPDHVYVAVNDGSVYALRADDGTEMWRHETGAIANLSPTLSGHRLLVATREGRLLMLDAVSGIMEREQRLRGPATVSPVVVGACVFVADTKRRLYCFGPGHSASNAQIP